MAWITKPQRKKRYQFNNQSADYYNTKYWKALRNSYIQQHPLCERCLSFDKVTPAEHVHHIVPFLTGENKQERWKLLLDNNNLMSVCQECHRWIHNHL